MSRPRQETEVRYRIVVDTVIPPYPDRGEPQGKKDQWVAKYGCIYLLATYESNNYDNLSPIKRAITISKKGGRYGGWGSFTDQSEFDFHVERSEVVWDWVDVDL